MFKRPAISLGIDLIAIWIVMEFLNIAFPNVWPFSGHCPYLWDVLHLMLTAGLGVSFYTLYTASKYIVARTYDPHYEEVYFIRLILGVAGGTLLGLYGKELFGTAGATSVAASTNNVPLSAALTNHLRACFALTNAVISGETATNVINTAREVAAKVAANMGDKVGYGPTVLALVGGFSAEAVYQVLQRVSDICVAAVRGSDKDVIDAKTAEAKSKAKEEVEQKKNEARKPLEEAYEAVVKAGASPDVVNGIKKAKDALSS